MKKYRLINTKTKEETICSKIMIHGLETNNKNIDISKLVDNVEVLAKIHAESAWGDYYNNLSEISGVLSVGEISQKDYISGYNKAKETYQYTKKDMIDLINSLKDYTRESDNILGHDERDAEEFLKLWEESKIITLYYE